MEFRFKDFSTLLKPENLFESLPKEIITTCEDGIYIANSFMVFLFSRNGFYNYLEEKKEKRPYNSYIAVKRFMHSNAYSVSSHSDLAGRVRWLYENQNKKSTKGLPLHYYFYNKGEYVTIVPENRNYDYINGFWMTHNL